MGPADETLQTAKDDVLLRTLKLAADGANWVIFKTRFSYAMGRDLTGHVDGTERTTPPALSTAERSRPLTIRTSSTVTNSQ